MPSNNEVQSQLELLATHRRTLAHYLRQQAILGLAYTPPGVSHGLFETREQIRRIKAVLRSWQIQIDDQPDDEDTTPPITSKAKFHLAIMFSITAACCAFLSVLQVPANFITTIGFGIMAIYSAVITILPSSYKFTNSNSSEVFERLYSNPLLTSFYIFCYFEFLSRFIGSLAGGVVGATLALSGADDAIDTTLPIVSTTFVGISSIITIIPISKYATHRIQRFPLIWIYSVIIFSAFFDNILISLVYDTGVSLIGVAVQILIINLMFITSDCGYFWAKQTHVAYVMNKLFRNLSDKDRNALIDLIYSILKN